LPAFSFGNPRKRKIYYKNFKSKNFYKKVKTLGESANQQNSTGKVYKTNKKNKSKSKDKIYQK